MLQYTYVSPVPSEHVRILIKALLGLNLSSVSYVSYSEDTFQLYGDGTFSLADQLAVNTLLESFTPERVVYTTYTPSTTRIPVGSTVSLQFQVTTFINGDTIVLKINDVPVEIELTGNTTVLELEAAVAGAAVIEVVSATTFYSDFVCNLSVFNPAVFTSPAIGLVAVAKESKTITLPIDSVQVSGSASDESWKPVSQTDFTMTLDVPVTTTYLLMLQISVQKAQGKPKIGFDFVIDGEQFESVYEFGRNFQDMGDHVHANAVATRYVTLPPGTHTIMPIFKVTEGAALIDGRLSEVSLMAIPV